MGEGEAKGLPLSAGRAPVLEGSRVPPIRAVLLAMASFQVVCSQQAPRPFGPGGGVSHSFPLWALLTLFTASLGTGPSSGSLSKYRGEPD